MAGRQASQPGTLLILQQAEAREQSLAGLQSKFRALLVYKSLAVVSGRIEFQKRSVNVYINTHALIAWHLNSRPNPTRPGLALY